MSQLLDLQVEIATRPPDTSPETGAPMTLRCEALKLKYSEGLFSYPLTKNEQEDLRWYLEDYWKWPFEGFAQRGSIVEQLLPMLGQRLYKAAFGEGAGRNLIQQWQADTSGAHQISIVTTDAGFLSLPWELLHDGHDFLALQAKPPISIVRRVAESRQPSPLLPETLFKKPLHVLLITARPVDEGQVDARLIAREVVDVLQEERAAGEIELEFLRPPTFDELIKRLSKKDRPVHVVHFDGHGVFYRFPRNQNGNDEEWGRLFFEKEDGKGDPVDAASLAEILRYGDVPLAVLNACQSAAIGERDISSSVAVQLLNGGLQAVVAMSASVLTTSAALYVKAFYGTLAAGGSLQAAHEQAQRALREQPERHTFQRRLDEAGKPVSLQDWWLPHLYLQHPLELRPTSVSSEPKLQRTPSPVRLSKSTPDEPRYGFKGRARELLTIERWLIRGKLIVIHGFGGMGKTALAREAADWLTRTGMYQGVCFVSFEGGRGNATSLLSQLGFFLDIHDSAYTPDDMKKALQQLQAPLKQQRILLIADNLESILQGGEAPLDAEERTELWTVLLDLQRLGAGVLLTTQITTFGDGHLSEGVQVVYLPLAGLARDDAYQLATSLLTSLRIDRRRSQYQPLRELLQQLGHHPLSIQLVLPALRTYSLTQIQGDFVALLPQFSDDAETGRNRSLLASLEYSLQRLNEKQRGLLLRLTVFEGGALENLLLVITEMAEADWGKLRSSLEQAALLTIERLEGVNFRFLHFHPVLIPYLRGDARVQDKALMARYAQQYYQASNIYYEGDNRYPVEFRAIVRRELPNLRRAFGWMLETGDLEQAADIADKIGRFLTIFGLHRKQQQMHQRVAEALVTRKSSTAGMLTRAEYLHEFNLSQEEERKGYIQAARARSQRLLARIESQPQGNPLGLGSVEHALTLGRLGRCLEDEGNLPVAEQMYRRAIALSETLVQHDPENQSLLRQQGTSLSDLGNVLHHQGQYAEAKKAHEQASQIFERTGDLRNQAVSGSTLGAIALEQGKYLEARMRYQRALETFHALGEPTVEAQVWHQLGSVALEEQNWTEAERCYRESLSLTEQLGDRIIVALTCNQLGKVATFAHRFAEAKDWFQRAVVLSQQADPTSGDHATYLSCLASCLQQEARTGKVQDVSLQLEEARRYAEQSLAIKRVLGGPDLWFTFGLLAIIEEMQGHHEEVRAYRRKEREAYASFAGNRYQIDQQFGALFPHLASAQDDLEVRVQVEGILAQLEASSGHVSEAIHRIWAGERDWQTLVENLGNVEALFVLRVLETLGSDTATNALSLEQRLATLPPRIREALAAGDQQAFYRAFDALSAQEQQGVREFIQTLQAESLRREE